MVGIDIYPENGIMNKKVPPVDGRPYLNKIIRTTVTLAGAVVLAFAME